MLVFSSLQDHQAFSELLDGTENWLYEEGADQDKQTYINKLEEIHVSHLSSNTFDHRLAFVCHDKLILCSLRDNRARTQ